MADEELKKEIDQYIDEVWDDVVADITTLCAIQSVEDLPTAGPGAPYGQGPAKALACGLDIAGRLGLEPHNCDGNVGYADLKGASEKQIALIGHLDTVPLGTGWRHDPLTVVREDGCLVGRGVADDKGPTVLAMYAAKFFHDRGEELPYTLRLIFGCNEETGMQDVHYYIKNFPQPDFLFTPDAEFPVCYGEKGGFDGVVMSGEMPEDGVIVSMEGGIVPNAIPDEATATVRADAAKLPAADRIEVSPAGEGLTRIDAHGIGGHASKPEGTINAILLLVDYLRENDLCSEQEREFLDLEHLLLSTTDGSAIGIACSDEHFGPLTIIGGTLAKVDNRYRQTIDSRFPLAITGDKIEAAIEKACEGTHAEAHCDRVMETYLTDPTSGPIQVLINTYNEVAGTDAKPFTMGGGTYAREFANAASFGPEDARFVRPDWVNGEHSPNEGVVEEEFRFSLKVYILAIARLMRLEF
jgi:succinyl-diaminopimelate desuccinylase